MAIDIPRRQLKAAKKHVRKETASPSAVRQGLCELYQFLARRTDSEFNKTIAHRLVRSRRNLAPISVTAIEKHLNGRQGIACVVGTVTDDPRVPTIQKMSVCALRFTEKARARIEAVGGECLTFDELALRCPTGTDCIIFRGHTKNRKAEKYFGRAPGLPGSHARPRSNPKYSH